jgi:hypothetical protein
MNRGADSQKSKTSGYTIVETLIFLAASGLMLTMALVFISGKQARQQFQTSVRDFETTLADIANDVSTGYYQNGAPLACAKGGSPVKPVFSTTANALGTNSDCIFVGTVIKLGEDSGGSGYEQFTQLAMAGLRLNGSGLGVVGLAESNPKVIDVPGEQLKRSLGTAAVSCIRIGADTNPCTRNNAAIGFFSTFDGTAVNDGGTIKTDVISYPTVSLDNTLSDAMQNINNDIDYATVHLNPGVTICLVGGNQHAYVKIGGDSSSNLTITSEINEGSVCS